MENAKLVGTQLLAHHAWSRAELVARLVRRGFAEELAQAAVAHLEHLGFTSDAKLAVSAVDAELRKKPAGRKLLEHKLSARGLSPDLAAHAIDAALADSSESQRAQALVMDELARRGGVIDDATRRRVAALLARRGFDEETALNAVAAVLGPASEPTDDSPPSTE